MEGIVGLIIFIFVVISWIAKALEQQVKNAPPPAPANPQPKPHTERRLQQEIENFLKEVQQKKPQQEWRQATPERTEQEFSRKLPHSGGEQSRKKSKQKKERRRETQTQSSRSSQPANLTAASNAGSLLVEQYLQTQTSGSFSRELREILSEDQWIAIRLLAQQQKNQPGSSGARSAPPVAQLLNSENIRNSFIIQEILNPPKALRSR